MDLAGDLSKLALALARMVASQGDSELCVSTKRTEAEPSPAVSTGCGCPFRRPKLCTRRSGH